MAQTPRGGLYKPTCPHAKDILRSVPSTLKPLYFLEKEAGSHPNIRFFQSMGIGLGEIQILFLLYAWVILGTKAR